ncbi:MAG: hypothetical protein Q4D62_02290 [Planctomycetia bacterium]|nr:hypothetical protein [Planctomycetia bacterium]
MTSKLLRKLLITTRKITVSFPALLVLLSGTVAWTAEDVVRLVYYQKSPTSPAGSLARQEEAPVKLVSYESSRKSASATASSSGRALKWVPVNAPEAREIQQRSSQAIPTEYSEENSVRLVSAEEQVSSNTSIVRNGKPVRRVAQNGNLPGVNPTGETSALEIPTESLEDFQSLNGNGTPSGLSEMEIPEMGTLDDVETPNIPSLDESPLGNTLLEEDSFDVDALKPGAIGNGRNQGELGERPADNSSVAPRRNEILPHSEEMELPESSLPVPESNLGRRPSLSEGEAGEEVQREDPWNQFDRKITLDNSCPKPRDMKMIREITNDITPPDGNFPIDCPLASEDESFPVRQFAGTHVTWTASNLCHKPLYFEQPAVERYGHSAGPILQPLLSGAEFIITVPALPYLIAMDPVNECQYPLGYYRPGSCAPYKWNPVPFTIRAGIAEGGIATALVFLIP